MKVTLEKDEVVRVLSAYVMEKGYKLTGKYDFRADAKDESLSISFELK